jgi:hypothetical protein
LIPDVEGLEYDSQLEIGLIYALGGVQNACRRHEKFQTPRFPEIKSDRFRHLTQTEAVKQTLLEAGRPMKLAEIIEVLIGNGLETHGKTAREMQSSINSVLSAGKKTKIFDRISKGVWTLASFPNITVDLRNSKGAQH